MQPDPLDPASCARPSPLCDDWQTPMHVAVQPNPPSSAFAAPFLINPSRSWHSGQQTCNSAAPDFASLRGSERHARTRSHSRASESPPISPILTNGKLQRTQSYSPRPRTRLPSNASARRALTSRLRTRYPHQQRPPNVSPSIGESIKTWSSSPRPGLVPDSGSDSTSGLSAFATDRRTSDSDAALENEARSSSEDGGVSISSDHPSSSSLLSARTSASISTAATSSAPGSPPSSCSFSYKPKSLVHAAKRSRDASPASPLAASHSPAGLHEYNTLHLLRAASRRPGRRSARTSRPDLIKVASSSSGGSAPTSRDTSLPTGTTSGKLHSTLSALSPNASSTTNGTVQSPVPQRAASLRSDGNSQSPAIGGDSQMQSAATQSSLSSPCAQAGKRARSESVGIPSHNHGEKGESSPPPPPPPAGRPPGPGATGNGSRSGSTSGSGSGSGSGDTGNRGDSEGLDHEGETEDEDEEPSPGSQPALPQPWSEDCPVEDMDLEDMPGDLMDATTAAQIAFAYQPHNVYIHPHAYLHPHPHPHPQVNLLPHQHPHPHPLAHIAPGPGEMSWANVGHDGLVRYTLRPPTQPSGLASLPGGAHFTTAADATLWFGSEMREMQFELSLTPLWPAPEPSPVELIIQVAERQEQEREQCASADGAHAPFGGPDARRYFVLWPQCSPGRPPNDGSTATAPAQPPSESAWVNQLLPAVANLEPKWTEWDWGV